MKPIRIAAALIGAASMLSATPALADRIRVFVKNCYSEDIFARSANGKDKNINETKRVNEDGGIEDLNCRSQGKGRCFISAWYVQSAGNRTHEINRFSVPERHWVKVYWARGLDGRDKLHADVTAEQPMTCGGETPGPTTHF